MRGRDSQRSGRKSAGRTNVTYLARNVDGETTDRQVFWLPDRPTCRPFPSVARQWLMRRSSPDTAAGPRRIRTVFPILWRATHPPAPRSRLTCYRCQSELQAPRLDFLPMILHNQGTSFSHRGWQVEKSLAATQRTRDQRRKPSIRMSALSHLLRPLVPRESLSSLRRLRLCVELPF
jgi:hypothetical protein